MGMIIQYLQNAGLVFYDFVFSLFKVKLVMRASSMCILLVIFAFILIFWTAKRIVKKVLKKEDR